MLIAMPCVLLSQDYEITEAPFNSEEADFSGSFNGNQFVFSSTRAKTNLSFLEDTLTESFFTDLYVVEMKGDGEFSKAESLKGNVNTLYNEGQASFSQTRDLMVYTGNMKQGKTNKVEKVEEFKLGLFIAEKFRDSWLMTAEFPYNSREGKYSVAHPCLNSNDSVLYFASNMPGGYGGSDIYRSFWINNIWSAPENLGKEINSKGNEFFPFINEFGVLFFSTNARDDSEGMDIYYSTELSGNFLTPEKLNGTINSEYDEFAYAEKPGMPLGTFSSNRNNGVDDIFFFAKYVNNFKNCHDNEKPFLCYHIVDEKLSKFEDMPFAYQWNLGDGTLLYGNEIDHCFDSFGKYTVTLNVIDTLTQQIFAKVSQVEIDVALEDKPYISCRDTTYTTIPFECKVDLTQFKTFEVDHIEWELSDGAQYREEQFQHQFKEPGTYQIKCGLVGKKKGKVQPKVCVFKDIVNVTQPDNLNLPAVLSCCDQSNKATIAMKHSALVVDNTGRKLSPFYRLIIAESKTQLGADYAMFENVNEEIAELKTENGYEYSISKASEWKELYPLYEELKDGGFSPLRAEAISETEFNHRLVQVFKPLKEKEGKLDSSEKSSLATSVNTFAIMLTKSTERKEFSDPLFSKIEHEILEIKYEDGFAYVIQNSPSSFALLGELKDAKTNGFENAEIIEMSATEWQLNEQGRSAYAPKPNEKSIKKSFRILIAQSKEAIPFNSEIFSQITQVITEIKTEEGYSYTIENAPSWEELSTTLNSLKSIGFESAQIRSYEEEDFNSSILKQGPYEQSKELSNSSYKILLLQSKESIPFSDAIFSKVEQEITQIKTESGYAYVIEDAATWEDLSSLLDDVKKEGFTTAETQSFEHEEFSKNTLKRGQYQPVVEKSNTDQLYTLTLLQSEERVPFNDERFSHLDEKIIEMKQQDDQGYQYSIRNTNHSNDLLGQLEMVKDDGFPMAFIDSMSLQSFNSRLSKIGEYITPKNKQALNVEFAKLSDIKFEYNSAEIRPESFANLNYIASMLLLEDDFSLRLFAHTCNLGGTAYNDELSQQRAQSVVNYFISKGVKRERLFPTGFGMNKPKASNNTEEGRKVNRRVEFVIVFNTRVTP